MTCTYRLDDFDLEGMDTSWNSSQWVDIKKSDRNGSNESDNSDTLPQFDGPADHKTGMC